MLRLPDAATRLAWLLSHIGDLPGSGIIYALTVSAAEDTARLLREAGHEVRAYTGQTDPAEREESERLLKENRVKALVATSALGMGFDKPDLAFVLHLGAPSSPVAYYQQVGRAGRATAQADVLLLPGPEDEAIWQYFATSSMPEQAKATAVLDELDHEGGALSTVALEARVDIRRSRLELLLKVLDVDGAVERVQGGWRSTGVPWVYDAERYERIAAARRDEQRAMLEYESTSGCRMEFLQRALDDPAAAPCGRCDTCTSAWYPTSIEEATTAAADAALSRVGVLVEPRAQWPSGMGRLGLDVRGNIPAGERLEPGRALARLTDLGWGGPAAGAVRPGRPRRRDLPRDGRRLRARAGGLGVGDASRGGGRDAVALAPTPRRLPRAHDLRGRPPSAPRLARADRQRPGRQRWQQRLSPGRGRRRASPSEPELADAVAGARRRRPSCSWTTWSTAAGRSPSRAGCSGGPAPAPCCRSCSRHGRRLRAAMRRREPRQRRTTAAIDAWPTASTPAKPGAEPDVDEHDPARELGARPR